MTKATPDALQAEGERLLQEWGIAGDATPAALAARLHRAAPADIAIAHRLGAVASPESAAVLRQLESETADKRVRKEAKRALYRLEQRGVAMPNEPPPPPAPLLGAAIDGYVSPIDGRGDQLVWLLKAQPGGVAHFFAIINDPEGLREAELNAVTRKTLKGVREELERKHDLRLVEIDWHYADFLMHRAFEWARARGTRMAGDYPGLRAQLTRQPPPAARPSLPAVEAAARAADHAALAQSAELLHEPEFRTWFLTPEDLKPYLEELAGVKDSPLVLNPMQQQERFEAVIVKAVDGWFGDERRESWARRLTEMAVYLAASRRAPRAAQALAVARELAAGRPPHELPLCDTMMRASLSVFFQVAMQEQQEREKSSLVLTPQQAAARRERPS